MLACAAVLVLLCVLVCLVPRASCASCSCWWLARACVPAVLRVRGCACVCGLLVACLLWVCVLVWVRVEGRSSGLSWLLVVGCVRRMSSVPVVAGGVVRVLVAGGCAVAVCGGVLGGVAGVCPHGGCGGAVGGGRDRSPLPPTPCTFGRGCGRGLMGPVWVRATMVSAWLTEPTGGSQGCRSDRHPSC